MKALRGTCLVVVGLAFALASLAKDDPSDEVPSDVPVRVQKDIFYPPIRLAAGDGIIESGPSGGHSSPWVVDLEGDGVKSLVVGDFSGFFRYYRNEGTNEKPRYAKAVPLKAGSVVAQVPIY